MLYKYFVNPSKTMLDTLHIVIELKFKKRMHFQADTVNVTFMYLRRQRFRCAWAKIFGIDVVE